MDCTGSPRTSHNADDRPAIWVLFSRPRQEEVERIVLLGLEEEGIPAEVRASEQDEPAGVLARHAALGSALNVGIGICGADSTVALHHRELPAERPLVELTVRDCNSTDLRRLGANAARLVKGNPLLFPEPGPPGVHPITPSEGDRT